MRDYLDVVLIVFGDGMWKNNGKVGFKEDY